MAFKLDYFVADGVRFQGPGPIHGKQTLVFGISAANTDTAMNVGDLSGTFWTDAKANAATGEMATKVVEDLTRLYPNFQAFISSGVDALAGRVQAAAAAGAAYTRALNATTKLPEYVFAASNGITSGVLVVELLLKPGQEPLKASYNLGVS
jgi:hypothetical protein